MRRPSDHVDAELIQWFRKRNTVEDIRARERVVREINQPVAMMSRARRNLQRSPNVRSTSLVVAAIAYDEFGQKAALRASMATFNEEMVPPCPFSCLDVAAIVET